MLSGQKYSKIGKVLFLAKFAPLSEDYEPKFDDVWGQTPFYHASLFEALSTLGPEIIATRQPHDILERAAEYDFVYTIFNRGEFRNSEVLASTLCEYVQKPFLGAPPNIRAVGEDKHLTKVIARSVGIDTPDWTKIEPWDRADKITFPAFPCILKWRFGGDSARISVVQNQSDALDKVKEFQSSGVPIIAEAFIEGTDATTAVLGADDCRIFRTVNIETDDPLNIQTFNHKKFGTGHRNKKFLQDPLQLKKIENCIRLIHDALGPIDYYRCDFRVTSSEVFFIEINPICNLDPDSSYFGCCRHAFLDYSDLINEILTTSAKRQGWTVR